MNGEKTRLLKCVFIYYDSSVTNCIFFSFPIGLTWSSWLVYENVDGPCIFRRNLHCSMQKGTETLKNQLSIIKMEKNDCLTIV